MKKVFRSKNHLAHVRLDQEPYFQAGSHGQEQETA